MLIKTINLTGPSVAIAGYLYRMLLAPPAFDWSLTFRGPGSPPGASGRVDQLLPVLSIAVPPTAADYLSKIDVIAFATQLGQRILGRQESIDLGGISLRLPELLNVRLDQSSIARGYLTLPPIAVEIPGVPDPQAVGISAMKDRHAFLVHLRGRVSGAPLEVRLTF